MTLTEGDKKISWEDLMKSAKKRKAEAEKLLNKRIPTGPKPHPVPVVPKINS